jgi:ubiquitin-protein ligase
VLLPPLFPLRPADAGRWLLLPLLRADMIQGPKGSPYEGGCYHGKLRFPPEYPFKPPAIYMLTPNGRFKPNTKLCLSMSDFHPETWCVWGLATASDS